LRLGGITAAGVLNRFASAHPDWIGRSEECRELAKVMAFDGKGQANLFGLARVGCRHVFDSVFSL
jgi:hypothetical protein